MIWLRIFWTSFTLFKKQECFSIPGISLECLVRTCFNGQTALSAPTSITSTRRFPLYLGGIFDVDNVVLVIDFDSFRFVQLDIIPSIKKAANRFHYCRPSMSYNSSSS
jgi:hypothetical protein